MNKDDNRNSKFAENANGIQIIYGADDLELEVENNEEPVDEEENKK